MSRSLDGFEDSKSIGIIPASSAVTLIVGVVYIYTRPPPATPMIVVTMTETMTKAHLCREHQPETPYTNNANHSNVDRDVNSVDDNDDNDADTSHKIPSSTPAITHVLTVIRARKLIRR